MEILQKIKSLILNNKKKVKIIGLVLLYLGAGLGFYQALFVKKNKARKETLNPMASITPLKKPAFSKAPQISIPPQPSLKPKLKTTTNPSPSPEIQTITSPSPSPLPNQENSPSPLPSASPEISPSTSPSPSGSIEPATNSPSPSS